MGYAGGRIEPTVGDLIASLRGRMADTNRNLAAAAVVLCAHIVRAMGAPFEKVGRSLLAPILAILPDNKQVVRNAVGEFVATYARTCSLESLREPIVTAFAVPKCAGAGKACALDALCVALVDRAKLSKADCQAVAHVAAIGMEDRAIEARTAAQACIYALAAICPAQHITAHQDRDVTPAQLKLLVDTVRRRLHAHSGRLWAWCFPVPVTNSVSCLSPPCLGAPVATCWLGVFQFYLLTVLPIQ